MLFSVYELDLCRQCPIVSFILNVFSAHGCKTPVNIICGGGVTPTVPVTESSQLNDRSAAEKACLGNSWSSKSEGETTLTEHECMIARV